jgi:hypothetical protein
MPLRPNTHGSALTNLNSNGGRSSEMSVREIIRAVPEWMQHALVLAVIAAAGVAIFVIYPVGV